jgi:hypothetical protein
MRTFAFLPAAALLFLTACSEQPAPTAKKEEAKPLEPVSGLSAVYKMFQVARTWDPNPLVLKLESMHLSEVPDVPAKAGAWSGTFTSSDQSRLHGYTFSLVEEIPTLHKGVFQVSDEAYSPKGKATKPFDIRAATIDSDAAYETAKANPKAVDYEKKFPGKPITILLEKSDRFPNPAWRVIWGPSASQSNFSIFIDSSTGKFLEIMH